MSYLAEMSQPHNWHPAPAQCSGGHFFSKRDLDHCRFNADEIARFKRTARRHEMKDEETGAVGVFYVQSDGHIFVESITLPNQEPSNPQRSEQ